MSASFNHATVLQAVVTVPLIVTTSMPAFLSGNLSGSSVHEGREYQREADEQNTYKQILEEG